MDEALQLRLSMQAWDTTGGDGDADGDASAAIAECIAHLRLPYGLAVLVALYVANQWARMLPSFLVSFDPVRLALAGIKEGPLAGYSFEKDDAVVVADKAPGAAEAEADGFEMV